jgi:hypothetical protein
MTEVLVNLKEVLFHPIPDWFGRKLCQRIERRKNPKIWRVKGKLKQGHEKRLSLGYGYDGLLLSQLA